MKSKDAVRGVHYRNKKRWISVYQVAICWLKSRCSKLRTRGAVVGSSHRPVGSLQQCVSTSSYVGLYSRPVELIASKGAQGWGRLWENAQRPLMKHGMLCSELCSGERLCESESQERHQVID